jgi:hypothetical protein
MQQLLVAGIEEENVQIALPARVEQLKHVAHLTEEGSHADVDAKRHPRHPATFAKRNGLGCQQCRQVVDAEKSEIFESMERLRLPGAR